jgi:hypothetical protein
VWKRYPRPWGFHRISQCQVKLPKGNLLSVLKHQFVSSWVSNVHLEVSLNGWYGGGNPWSPSFLKSPIIWLDLSTFLTRTMSFNTMLQSAPMPCSAPCFASACNVALRAGSAQSWAGCRSHGRPGGWWLFTEPAKVIKIYSGRIKIYSGHIEDVLRV